VVTDLRFGVLGPLEVFRDGQPVVVPAGRRRTVLACLLAHAGRPVATDVLIEAAWRDDLPMDPDGALHTVVSRLRAALGADVLRSHPAGYTLVVGEDSVDAHRFESLRTGAGGSTPPQAATSLREALELWRGPAYDGLADRGFAAAEAQRLERLRLEATEELAALLVEAGDHGRAAALLEALLDEQPFRERAVELLMTALYRAGRQADALARYRAHREVLRDELGLDPSPVLEELELRILGHDLPHGADHGEPVTATPWVDTSTAFFGRDVTLADLLAAVVSDRLVTVTGVGGVGKTRLVAEALPALGDRLGTSVVVVELAPVAPGRAGAAVADALGLETQADAVEGDLLEYLSLARTVLVLDGCEHLRGEVAALADAVTRRCPRVRLLATSRHRLGIVSERVVPLVPLPAPHHAGDDPASLADEPAVRLFVDRVCRLRPSFALTSANAGAVAEICRRVDGLPLALELAASRAATLGVQTVVGWLRTSPVAESLPDLRTVVEWSARLLTAEQRRLLGHVAVFADRFRAEDVVSVAAGSGPWDGEQGVLDALEELVESSLVAGVSREGEVDYRMLALVRSYAATQLAASGDEEQVRLTHASWVRGTIEDAAREWVSGGAAVASRRLARAGPDVKAALRWALSAGRLDLAAAITGQLKLCLHWLPGVELGDLVAEVAHRCLADPRLTLGIAAGAMTSAERGDLEGTRRLAEPVLASASSSDAARFLACLSTAIATFYSGEHEESAAWLERAAALPELPAGYRVEPFITQSLLACAHDDLDAARSLVSVALVGSQASGSEAASAFALYASGEIKARADPGAGATEFRSAAADAERIGAAHISQVSRLALFAVLVRQGEHDDARRLAVPLLRDVRRSRTWPQVWTTLRIAAELLNACGRREESVLLLAAARAAPDAPPLVGDDVSRYARLCEELERDLGEVVVARIGELAASMPRSQVVDRAVTLLAALR
jgi:predicted ATPase/DNA-binding SARP family transcriptional activator